MVAEVKPLFPGQTGLTPGRRAEVEAAGATDARYTILAESGEILARVNSADEANRNFLGARATEVREGDRIVARVNAAGESLRSPDFEAALVEEGVAPRWVVRGRGFEQATDSAVEAVRLQGRDGNNRTIHDALRQQDALHVEWDGDGSWARDVMSDEFKAALEAEKASMRVAEGGESVAPKSGLLSQLVQAAEEDAPGEADIETPDLDAEGLSVPTAEEGVGSGADVPEAPAVTDLRAKLEAFDPAALASSDPRVRADAERTLSQLSEQAARVDSVYDGVEALVRAALPRKVAERVVVKLQEPAPAMAGADTQVEVPSAVAADAGAAPTPRGVGGAALGTLASTLFLGPIVGAGMAVLQGLRAAQRGVQRGVQTARVNSFDVIGRQVKSLSSDIEREAQWLRAHGMDGLVDEMKASGHTLREAVARMERGGPLEKIGLQYQGLMQDPEFKQRYEALQDKIERFGHKAEHYAKAGAVIGRDVEPDVEVQYGRVESATDGFPVQNKDGGFGLLGDRLREIADKLRELVSSLLNGFKPGRG